LKASDGSFELYKTTQLHDATSMNPEWLEVA
jgi:hypothetical protein